MHIGSMLSQNRTSGFNMSLKMGQANTKKTQAGDEDENSKKTGSFKALEQKKKEEEFDIVTMLQKQKDSLQKRIGRYNEQLESIAKQKEAVPYEMTVFEGELEERQVTAYELRRVNENQENSELIAEEEHHELEAEMDGSFGKAELVPSGTMTVYDIKQEAKQVEGYSYENRKIIDALTAQEDAMTANIKSANEEMAALDEQIRKAAIEQEKLKTEKANKEKEEEVKEKEAKKDEQLTDEEKQEKAEKAQVKFFAQSDSVKKYIQESKITQAKMQAEKTFKEISMTNDAYRQEAAAVNAAHHADQTRLDTIADEVEKETGVRPELISTLDQTVTSTSITEEFRRVHQGRFGPDESKSAEGKEIADLQAGIEGIENSITENVGDMNKKARELGEEKEEDGEDKKDKEEAEKNKGEAVESRSE